MAFLDLLWRQRLAVALILIFGIATTAFAVITQKPKYSATTTVLYTGHYAGNSLPLGQLDMATLATSQVVTMRALRELHSNESPADLASAIVTRPAFQSNIMPITFSSSDPAQAIAGANAVAHALRDYFQEIARSQFSGLTGYLDKALQKRQREVAELDRKLDIASEDDPALAQDDAASTLGERLTALLSARDHESAALAGTQAQASAAAGHVGEFEPLARNQIANSDYVYRALQLQHANDAALLASERSQYTSAYPGLKGLSKRVAGENDYVEQRLSELNGRPAEESAAYEGAIVGRDFQASLVVGAQAQVSAYDSEIAQLRQELARLPIDGTRLAALRRERDTARTALQELAQRREYMLAEQAQAATTGTIEIIDEARVATASTSRGLLLNVGAALGFLMLAVTIAYLLDSADRRIRGVDGIAELYGKPVIATLKTH